MLDITFRRVLRWGVEALMSLKQLMKKYDEPKLCADLKLVQSLLSDSIDTVHNEATGLLASHNARLRRMQKGEKEGKKKGRK